MPMLTDFDLYLFGQGTYRRAYEKLGAHPTTRSGSTGVEFAVWAPSAGAVSVIGDFNRWIPGKDRLEPNGNSGIWSGFVPNIGVGTVYKYAIHPSMGHTWIEKADPYAFAAELRPNTASIVADIDSYNWGDETWMTDRPTGGVAARPISVYELHLSSWKRDPGQPERFLTYRELAGQVSEYASEMGFTHIELLPVAEHPLDMSWGYQVTGYFAPSARYGWPQDFMYFVDCCHRAGIGVLLDWVPGHFPKDTHGLAQFDGTHLYEHSDPRQGEHPDWGTLIFNYGRNEVRNFLVSNALFWLDRYHIDGLRVDAVASMLYLDYSRTPDQWIPNRYGGRENLEAISLLQEFNSAVHEEYPSALTIAEESTAWPGVTNSVQNGGLGFDLKWNMGWMHDTLEYMALDPVHRRFHQHEITFSLMYAFSERFLLPLSHDEVVHGKGSLLAKMPGDDWQKFANLRLLFGYMFGHPGKKLLFMGDEFGQWTEWNHTVSASWHLLESQDPYAGLHRGVQRLVSDLNHLYRDRPALHVLDADWNGFQWIDFTDSENSVIAFQRRARLDDPGLVTICNFTPVVRHDYRLGLPHAGGYREVLTTDDAKYGGSGVHDRTLVETEAVPWHGKPHSAAFTLPPLGALVLEYVAPD
jgi:1,4-alpha-glucan branching enzyme